MANEGHIIVKKDKGRYGTQQFFRDVDKGSVRPAFCYPRRMMMFKEETESMRKNLERGNVDPSRKMLYENQVKQRESRLNELLNSKENAATIIKRDKDGWKKRRDELAKVIADATPTRRDVKDRRVNPYSTLRREKQGEKGLPPLEKLKQEYIIISRAFQAAGDFEESNISFLQKDK